MTDAPSRRAGHRDDSRAARRVQRIRGTEVLFELGSPAAGLQTVARAAIRKPDGTWQVDRFDIEQAGIWTVRVIVVPASGQPVVLDAPIVIER